MITFDEALARIAQEAMPLGKELVPLANGAGRVLAEPLTARTDFPRRAVAAMDGYAVVDATTHAGNSLRLIGQSQAGAGFDGVVGPGEAVRIFTGAPMPAGADRCIMQEYAQRDGDHVTFAEGYGPGFHVRAAGADFSAGDVLLPAGTRLTPRAMVVAAAADVASIPVAIRPRVSVIGTGDELAAPGSAFERTDAIPESVTFGVAAAAQAAGAEIVARHTGIDDLPTLKNLAGVALNEADLVIVTGGASVGDRDFAKPMFEAHGLDLIFAKVAIKPGKPVWLGRASGKWVLGLPGNPTSAMVTARLFLAPLLARFLGQGIGDALKWRSLPLKASLPATGDRETFIRAAWDGDGVRPLGYQDSGAQANLAFADWLLRCPAGMSARQPMDIIEALEF